MDCGSHAIAGRAAGDNRQLFGPFFLGIVIGYFLWGIQITQSYYYYKSYRKTDKTWLKVSVGLIFVFDAAQTVCASEGAWNYMVASWGDQAGFVQIRSWGVDLLPLTDAITTSIVHFFYAQKIWTLLGSPYNYIWTTVVLSLSCLQAVGGIGASSFMLAIHNNIATLPRAKTWVSIWLATASMTDIVIASLMTWKLSKSRTGFKTTDDVISKLVQLTVETGVATSIIQIVDLITYLAWPFQAYHAFPTFISPKVYSNSMLAFLNSRPLRSTVGMNGGSWESRPSKPVDSIQIHTSQTITTSDYELKDKLKTGSKGREGPYPNVDNINELPFTYKVDGSMDIGERPGVT